MSFVSWQYPLLLATVFLIYWQVPRKLRIILLIAASYYFYACWDVRFLALILSTTCLDYLCGRGIHDDHPSWTRSAGLFFVPGLWLALCQLVPGVDQIPAKSLVLAFSIGAGGLAFYFFIWRLDPSKRKKAFVILSLGMNLLILGFFKYYGFFVENLKGILEGAGFAPNLPLLQILLPVGISFYTFQSLSYVIDVYRGKTQPCMGFRDYAAYISFFPQLVAGPIERSTRLLPQILEKRQWDPEHLTTGCRLIFVGVFKKVFIADNCVYISNYAFHPDTPLNAYWAILGIVAFAFQVYGDFSGYTDIARGSARLFGIHLNQNFRFPYLSVTPSDFWSRWHISLSNWFRDYLYIPLGGNRCGRMRTLVNLMLVMGIAGLWHGASWNFILWGCFHGLLLVLYRVTPGLNRLDSDEHLPIFAKIPAIVLMFTFVLIGWALFRSAEISQFGNWFLALGNWDADYSIPWLRPLQYLLFHVIFLIALQALTLKHCDEAAFGRFHWIIRGVIYVIGVVLIVGSPTVNEQFIYFQF